MELEDQIDDEPYIAEVATNGANDQLAERQAFEERLAPAKQTTEVERLAALNAPPVAPAPVAAPAAPAPELMEALNILREELREARAARTAPAPVALPPPEPTMVEQFDRDNGFYKSAMQTAGFKPAEDGSFTLEATRAVRAELRLADFEARQEKLLAAQSQRSHDSELQTVGRAVMGRLAGYEPLTELQQEALGAAIGTLRQRGVDNQTAIESAFREFAPMLRAKLGAAPAAAPVARRPISAAQQIVASPGMTQRTAQPTTSWGRLDAARGKLLGR